MLGAAMPCASSGALGRNGATAPLATRYAIKRCGPAVRIGKARCDRNL